MPMMVDSIVESFKIVGAGHGDDVIFHVCGDSCSYNGISFHCLILNYLSLCCSYKSIFFASRSWRSILWIFFAKHDQPFMFNYCTEFRYSTGTLINSRQFRQVTLTY